MNTYGDEVKRLGGELLPVDWAERRVPGERVWRWSVTATSEAVKYVQSLINEGILDRDVVITMVESGYRSLGGGSENEGRGQREARVTGVAGDQVDENERGEWWVTDERRDWKDKVEGGMAKQGRLREFLGLEL